MAKTTRTVYHRRKREGKTNYKKRLELLKGRKPRVVIRKTNNQIIVQLIKYDAKGDEVTSTFNQSNLKENGWKHNAKNIPAAYLTGLLAGKQSKVKEAILDTGLQTPHKGGRIYAALQGVIDAGVKVPASKEAFPSEDRLKGSHISKEVEKSFEKIKKKIE